jgi:hypothetical protein
MPMAGSAEHALWLDQRRPSAIEATATTPSITSPKFFSADAARSPPAEPPSSRLAFASAVVDTAAGSTAHDAWLRCQLFRRTNEEKVWGAPAVARQETSAALPPGVQVLLRGQDASAQSHSEWLDRRARSEGDEDMPHSARALTGRRSTCRTAELARQAPALGVSRADACSHRPPAMPQHAMPPPAMPPPAMPPTMPPAMPPATPLARPTNVTADSARHAEWLRMQLDQGREHGDAPSSAAGSARHAEWLRMQLDRRTL